MSSLKIDPQKRDYVVERGRPVTDSGLLTPAYFRLAIGRSKWLYAPDQSTYGSDFWMIANKRQTVNTPSTAAAIATRALQPLIDDGRALSVSLEAKIVARGAVGQLATIVDNAGKEEQLEFDPMEI